MAHSGQHTLEQRRAIETLNQHCVVVAGPGAGKTRVLVERILNILRRQGPSDRRATLDEVAAITFTRKAANEMKERLRAELGRLAHAATNQADKRYWLDLRRRIESAEITTIHGLCARVLSSQPVEAKIDPTFTILDEYLSQLLLTEAAEGAIYELLDSNQPMAVQLIIGYGNRREMVDALIRIYLDIRTLGLTLDAVEANTFKHLGAAADYMTQARQLEALCDGIMAIDKVTETMQKQKEALATAWQKGRDLIFQTPDLPNADALEESLEALKAPAARGRFKEPVQALRQQIERVQLSFYDACAGESTRLLLQALRALDQRYTQAKQARHALDYEDLQWKVRELFRNDPYIARRYAQRYKFLLVDEFQDTNSLQKDIIEQIALSETQSSNLFIVGDAKQSVYNFRGAEVEVFDRTARELVARGAAEIRLKENFRTIPPLIQVLNALFAQIMRQEGDGDEETARVLGYVPYLESRATRQIPEIEEPMELLLQINVQGKAAEDAREQEAQAIAVRIKNMVAQSERRVATRRADGGETIREARYGDIAILFRAMSDIKIYEYALRRAGIPYRVIAGKGFYQREEIQDILSVLTFLENRTDEIALTAALRSPLFGISDESLYWLRQEKAPSEKAGADHHPLLTNLLAQTIRPRVDGAQQHLLQVAAETLERLLELRNRVPLADLLEEILRLTDYRAVQTTYHDGYQRVANLSKLVELSRGFEAAGPHFLTDFIKYIEKFNEMESREAEAALETGPETDQGAVQIMTIHKAKGLEFPIVILPDLQREAPQRTGPMRFERSLGLGLKIPDMRGDLHKTALYEQVCERLRQRERYEAQRLFFVAATRARDYLILSGTFKPGKTERDLAKASNYLEWILTLLKIDEHFGETEVAAGEPARLLWEGVPLRITFGVPAGAESQSPEEKTLVERHPEIYDGKEIEAGQPGEPALAQTAEAILRRTERITPIADESAPLAVTKLAAFARCPRQYYYEVLLGLPESEAFHGNGDLSAQGGPSRLTAAERGRVLHRFCDLYAGAAPVAVVLARALEKEGFVDSSLQEQWVSQLQPVAQGYAEGPTYRRIERILRGADRGSVHSELDLIYRTPTLWLRGRVDKLIVDGAGQATLIDFKSGGIGADLAAAAHEHAVTMQIYAQMVRAALGHNELRAQIYFLDAGACVDLEESLLHADTVEPMLEHIARARTEAHKTGHFPARPDPARCRRCRCASYCPEKYEG